MSGSGLQQDSPYETTFAPPEAGWVHSNPMMCERCSRRLSVRKCTGACERNACKGCLRWPSETDAEGASSRSLLDAQVRCVECHTHGVLHRGPAPLHRQFVRDQARLGLWAPAAAAPRPSPPTPPADPRRIPPTPPAHPRRNAAQVAARLAEVRRRLEEIDAATADADAATADAADVTAEGASSASRWQCWDFGTHYSWRLGTARGDVTARPDARSWRDIPDEDVPEELVPAPRWRNRSEAEDARSAAAAPRRGPAGAPPCPAARSRSPEAATEHPQADEVPRTRLSRRTLSTAEFAARDAHTGRRETAEFATRDPHTGSRECPCLSCEFQRFVQCERANRRHSY